MVTVLSAFSVAPAGISPKVTLAPLDRVSSTLTSVIVTLPSLVTVIVYSAVSPAL